MFTELKERKKQGFTLIEIVVVLGIMAVLSAVLIPAVIHYAEESRVQRDESAMAELVNMAKNIMDSNIEAYDELYAIGQFIDADDEGVYIVWKNMGDTEGFVPYVMGEELQEMAPVFYRELTQTLEGPVFMQSGSYRDQYFVMTLEKDEDDELTWVRGDWSETEVVNGADDEYVPVTPDIPNTPNPPETPVDIPGIPPVDEDAADENAPISQPEEEKKDLPKATGTDPIGLSITWNGEMHLLLTPGETNQGTYYYKLSTDSTGLWQSGVPKASAVGDYQISYYIQGNENFQNSDVKMIRASILPGEAQFTHPTPRVAVFTGNPERLIETPGTTNPADKVHMVYSLDKTTWDPTPPARTEIGKYEVFYKLIGSPEVSVPDTVWSVIAEISPWQGNFAMPDALNPTYNGSAQNLLSAGTAPDGCTVYYRTETGAWGTKIPTATEAGSYNIYYKIDGGGRYANVGETLVKCEIKKATPVLALSTTRTIFNPPAMKTTITITNSSDGPITISSSDIAIADATLSNDKKSFALQGGNKGSAIVTISVGPTNNYHAASVQHNVEVTVGVITATATDGKATYNGLPQDGGAKVFVTTPASGYVIQYKESGTNTWQSTMPTFTNAGTYTVDYAISAEGFSQKTGSLTIQIEKAVATDALKPTVTGYEWVDNTNSFSPSLTNMKDGDGSPDWQLVSATITYSTFDEYVINEKVTSLPSVSEPGEVRLTDFVFRDRTGNHADVTINTFSLNSKIDGTLTASSTLLLKCYTATGDNEIYYRVSNGTLYLRKTSRAGYSIASVDTEPANNMFVGDNTAGITTVHFETTLLPTSLNHWFYGLSDLTTITYNVIDGEAVQLDTRFTKSMDGMFKGCASLQADNNGKIRGMDFASLYTEEIESYREMFAGCTKLSYLDVSGLDGRSATTVEGMFEGCSNLQNIEFGTFFGQNIERYDSLFKDCVKLKKLDLTNTNTERAVSMTDMFANTQRLETVILGGDFNWVTADGYLPAISSQHISSADGKWYDITNAAAYTPMQLADLSANESATKIYSSIPYYWLDMINGMRDGIKSDTLEGLGTVDVYIDGQLMQRKAIDWYHPYKHGTTYEFKNLNITSNLGYVGLQTVTAGDTLSGVLTHPTVSWLKFETIADDFEYTGGVQTFTAPASGYYQIEIWGAQGGNSIADSKQVGTGLAGGYSKGNVYLTAGQTIYFAVGGQGQQPTVKKDSVGGWNGGGNGTWDHNDDEVAGAGGGATAVYLSLIGDGQLKNYANNKDQVIIVAGGGGGSAWENSNYGGVGGGVTGGTAATDGPTAATQDSGYAFGVGESGVWGSGWAANKYSNGIPGAGGGWYGGRLKVGSNASSGGGSGYIGGVVNGSMKNGIRKGNGLAKITYSGVESYSVPTSQSFEYTGYVQEFVVPISGYYKLETWGAEGGVGTGYVNEAGRGGYTAGITYLTEGTVLYVYVGEYGIDQFQSTTAFNGGGHAYRYTGTSQPHIGGRGGGATDIRLVGGSWDNVEGLKSRIIVAGGGGGAQSTCGNIATAGHGGGLVGTTSYNMGYQGRAQDVARGRAYSTGGSQTAGGKGYNVNDGSGNKTNGSFGQGAYSLSCASGGGGGWYGGGSAYTSGGGGGSSYVTGYPGCDTTYRNYQGGYNFTNVSIIAGHNKGNGKAKITYMGDRAPAAGGTLTINNEIPDVGIFDLYVDGVLVGDDIVSYIGEMPFGTNWEMEPVTTPWNYLCAQKNGATGTLTKTGAMTVRWKYNTSVTEYGTLSDGNAMVANEEVLYTISGTTLNIYPANGTTGIIKNLMPQENMPWASRKATLKTVTTTGQLQASEYFCGMLYGATALTSVNLQSIDISRVQHLDNFFYGCTSLPTFTGFRGSAYVESFTRMFADCASLKTIDLSAANAVEGAVMTSMFSGVPIQQIKTPTYWFFADNCGLSRGTKWKHDLAGTVTTAEFIQKVMDPQYSGIWTKVA